MIRNVSLLLFSSLILSGCFFQPDKVETFGLDRNAKGTSVAKATVSSVSIVNDQLIINGTALDGVSTVRITGPSSFDETFAIESKTASNLIANGLQNISFAVGAVFSLIISDAYGAATFGVTFTLQDGAVTASKLSNMGAGVGQVLKYNGTTWVPSDLGGLTYAGNWNATTNVPDLSIGGNLGEYYIVNTAGIYDLLGGAGTNSWAVGDWVVWNNVLNQWEKIDNASNVQSFNGRSGSVTAQANDYTWAQIDKTTAPLSDLSDVDTTGVAAGKILKWNGTAWAISDDLNGGGAGSVTTTEIANGTIVDADVSGTAAIAQSKISGLATSLAAKEPTLTKGNLTEATSSVLTITGGTSAIIGAGASIEVKQANTTTSGYLSSADWNTFNGKASSDTHAGTICAAGEFLNGDGTCDAGFLDADGVDDYNAAFDTEAEIDAAVSNNGYGTGDLKADGSVAMTAPLDASTFGVKLKDGDTNYATLKANAAMAADFSLILPAADGTAGQVLKTDGLGNLAWASPPTGSVTSVTGTAPVVSSGGATPAISMAQANGATDGYLDNLDWTTFNNKQAAITTGTTAQYLKGDLTLGTFATDVRGSTLTGFTSGAGVIVATDTVLSAINKLDGNVAGKEPTLTKGNLTEATSSVLTITGGTSAIIGAGASIEVKQANTTTSGYLSSTDWNTFNGKQAALTNPITGTGTDNYVTLWNGTNAVDNSTITETKLNYLTDVTGNIQAQLDSKLASSSEKWDAAIGGINYTGGKVGIGTTTPSAQSHVKGSYSSALTGTSDITNGTSVVSGSGTLFTTELAVGDAVKLGTETFIVASITNDTNMTVTANAVADQLGVTPLKQPILFLVEDADGNEKFKVNQNGAVSITEITATTFNTSSTGNTSIAADTDSNASGEILFQTAGTTKAIIDNNGNLDLGPTLNAITGANFSIGSAAAPSVFSMGESDTQKANIRWDDTNNYLSFGTENTGSYPDTFVIKDGNVGIGTTTPNTKLTVGTAGANITNTIGSFYNGDESIVKILSDANTNGTGSHLHLMEDNPNLYGFDWWYDTGNNVIKLDSYNNNVKTEIITATVGGKVGIGTTAPSHNLQVKGTTGLFVEGIGTASISRIQRGTAATNEARPVIELELENTTSSDMVDGFGPGIDFTATDNTATATLGSLGFVRDGSDTSGSFQVKSGTSFQAGTPLFHIDTTGKIGIGTTLPDQLLHVAGTASAIAKVSVESGAAAGATLQLEGWNGASSELNQITGLGVAGGGLKFDTATTSDALRISASGDVGIGTTNPGLDNTSGPKLGPSDRILSLDGGNYDAWLQLISNVPDSTDLGGIMFTNSGGQLDNHRQIAAITAQSEYVVGTSTRGKLQFKTKGDGTDFKTQMSIDHLGRIGIGTTTPSAKLEIAGTESNSLALVPTTTVTLNANPATEIRLWGDGNKLAGRYAAIRSVNTGGLDQNELAFVTGFGGTLTERLRINDQGNVGIGTTDPSHSLHIAKSGAGAWAKLEAVDDGNDAGILLTQAGGIKWQLMLDDLDSGTNNNNFTIYDADVTDGSGHRFVIRQNGNVGIGTTDPSAKLQVKSDSFGSTSLAVENSSNVNNIFKIHSDATSGAGEMTLLNTAASPTVHFQSNPGEDSYILNGNLGIGTTAPAQKLDVNGNIAVAGTTVHTSDIRLKEDIKQIESSIDKIMQITGVEYFWKDREKDAHRQIGVIAQELQKVFPELVYENENTGFLSVNYAGLVAPLIEATKEQQRSIASLKKENAEIKAECSEIKAKNTEIEEENLEIKSENKRMKSFLCTKFSDAPFCKAK